MPRHHDEGPRSTSPDGGDADFYRMCAPVVREYLTRRHPHVDIDDVVSYTLWKAWQTLDGERDERAIRRYLLQIAHNRAVDLYRRQQSERRALLQHGPPLPSEDPEDQALARAKFLEVCKIIKSLSPDQRQVVRLRMFYELDHPAIANQLSITEVKSRQCWRRGREVIRERIKHRGYVVILLAVATAGWAAHQVQRQLGRGAVQHAGAATKVLGALGVGSFVVALPYLVAPDQPDDQRGSPGVVATNPPTSTFDREQPRYGPRPSPSPRQNGEPALPPSRTTGPSALPALPVRAGATLSPDPRGGRQESHYVEHSSPVGEVAVEGNRTATGPSSVHFLCEESHVRCPSRDDASRIHLSGPQ